MRCHWRVSVSSWQVDGEDGGGADGGAGSDDVPSAGGDDQQMEHRAGGAGEDLPSAGDARQRVGPHPVRQRREGASSEFSRRPTSTTFVVAGT